MIDLATGVFFDGCKALPGTGLPGWERDRDEADVLLAEWAALTRWPVDDKAGTFGGYGNAVERAIGIFMEWLSPDKDENPEDDGEGYRRRLKLMQACMLLPLGTSASRIVAFADFSFKRSQSGELVPARDRKRKKPRVAAA